MAVLIDVREERVHLESMELTGQWVDFYALLALARTNADGGEAFVSAEDVTRVGPWRHKAPASVGKEVARHLSQLKTKGLGSVVESRGRTRSWRLRISKSSVTFTPDRHSVQNWVDARSMSAVHHDGWIDDLRVIVDGVVMHQQGDAESALEKLDDLSGKAADAEPALEAWAALLRGKAAFDHFDEDDEVLIQLQGEWSKRPGAVGIAISARLRALIARRYRFEDPTTTLNSLTKLAAGLELRGDIGSLAAVLNVMGLLARRSGNPETGSAHLLRAVGLFGIAGDYPTLQAALFNLALCREDVLLRGGKPPDETLLQVIELCRKICACFGVGRNSAQAEICGAQWACEMGDTPRARAYLRAAEELLYTIDNTYEQACFLEIRARIELASPNGESDPIRDLTAAAGLFAQVGDDASTSRIRRTLAALRKVK